MSIEVSSVSKIMGEIKNLLENEFRNVYVEGEVTNFSRATSGHFYFSISDPTSVLSVAVFKGDALRNPVMRRLKDGDKVMLSGSIGLYQKRGSFQLIARRIQLSGKGDLKADFEKLKLKLRSLGLFDSDIKRAIPKFPKKIAVITAPGSAAVRDFINIFRRRSFNMNLLVVPALVQGEKAPEQLIRAISKACSDPDVDLIVLTRGGGSLEDLWAFNNEALAQAIYNCRIPVISAVGHEVDFTISDFVADLRCETPSAAAELITTPQKELAHRVSRCRSVLLHSMGLTYSKLENLLSRSSPKSLIYLLEKKLRLMERKLEACNLERIMEKCLSLDDKRLLLDELLTRLLESINKKIEFNKNRIDTRSQVLFALSPNSVLTRGYSYLEDSSGQVIDGLSKFNKLSCGSAFLIQFHDGKAKAQKVDNKKDK
ncbi:MAG: exodeoxyribonuclease VII large subunit [Bacteriovoracaceae bacterium]|jgi:exodeoxyribonuclease VII large subunit|nr:exodeoxyribonuclease VII large subunit [Bacteriovoracaceae bacterium]